MKYRVLILAGVLAQTLPQAQAQDAQEPQEIDRAAMEEAVREAEAAAAAFATEVAKRADAYSEEAIAITDAVMGRMKDVAGAPTEGPIEFSELLASAPHLSQIREVQAEPAGVMVLVSFSMPEEALRALVVDAHRAGIPVMLRGFAGGSLAETAKGMRTLLGAVEGDNPGEMESLIGGVVIDPRAFRIFGVEEVPVFIATPEALPDCDGLDCSAPPPAHDRIAGNISLKAALEAIAAKGTAGREEAQAALRRLERAP